MVAIYVPNFCFYLFMLHLFENIIKHKLKIVCFQNNFNIRIFIIKSTLFEHNDWDVAIICILEYKHSYINGKVL